MRSLRNVLTITVLLALVSPVTSVSGATPQNGRIAFSKGLPGQILSMAPDGTDKTRLTHSKLSNWDPAWSPSGSQIAFVRERRTRGSKLMIMAADGSDQKAILESKHGIVQPDWFPDETHILFCASALAGYRLFEVGADGSALTPIGPTRSCEPAVSPDGLSVVFARSQKDRSSRTDLFAMASDGSGLTRITSDARSSSPTWSPDGSLIAFIRRARSASPGGLLALDLFVTNADGSSRSRLTDTRRDEHAPNWSPDGTSIVFERNIYWDPGASTDLCTIAPDGSADTQLMQTGGVWESSPDWQAI